MCYQFSIISLWKMSFLNWPYSNAKEWLNISNLFTIFHNYENLPQFFIPKCLHSFDLTYKVTDWTIGLVWFWSFQHYMEKAENYFSIFFPWYPSPQSCDLTNFCILGDFERKMADNSDFKKTPHFICLKLNQICFTSLFCCCQVFICFKIKFLTTNVKTLITDYLMKIGFENPRFSLFSDAICSKS